MRNNCLFTGREAHISCERMVNRRTAKATIRIYTFEINHSEVHWFENYKQTFIAKSCVHRLFFVPTINSQITSQRRTENCSGFDL